MTEAPSGPQSGKTFWPVCFSAAVLLTAAAALAQGPTPPVTAEPIPKAIETILIGPLEGPAPAPVPANPPGETGETPTGEPDQTIADPSHELPSGPPVFLLPETPPPVRQALGGGLFPPEGYPLPPEGEGKNLGNMPGVEPRRGLLDSGTLEALFATRPPEPLHDPQMLLGGRDYDRLLRELIRPWLWERSPFRTVVVIMGGEQQLPPDFDPRSVHSAWFQPEDRGLIVLYFLGRPDRTLTIHAPETRRLWPETTLRELADSGVREAGAVHDPVEQLARFCYRSASRLDHLFLMGPPKPVLAAAPPKVPVQRRVWPWVTAGCAAGGAVAMGFGWLAKRRRKDDGEPIIFPEQELYGRLGAEHCGGKCALVSFARADE